MSKKNSVLTVASVIALVSLVGLYFGIRQIHDITLTSEQIQEKIDAKLPISKHDVTVSEVSVSLRSDQINIQAVAEGKKLGQPFTVAVSSVGHIDYNPNEGTFYFRAENFKVINFQTNGKTVSQKVEGAIDKIEHSEAVGKLVGKLPKFIRESKRLNSVKEKILENKENIGEKIESVALGAIEGSTKWVLGKIPVYKLPDTIKGNAVRMLVESIEVNDGSLTIHLSFWQFGKIVVIWIIAFLFALLLMIIVLTTPGALDLISLPLWFLP